MRNITRLLATTSLIGFNTGDKGTEINTPLGRIVWGHPTTPKHATDNNNQKKYNDKGEPIMEVSFGLAIPQDQFAAQVWPAMAQEIAKGYPNGIPGNFSYKITQPHEIDKNGKPYAEREGYAGCVVLACSTMLQPPMAYVYENGAYRQIGADQIKCGDYVQVGLNLKVNVPSNRAHTPSIYVNPLTVLLCYEGDAIAGAYQADPTQVFGAAPQIAAPPPGARPIGAGGPMQQPPMGAGMPGMGGQPMQQGTVPGATMPGYGQPPMGNQMPGAVGMGQPAMTNAPMQQPGHYAGNAAPGYMQGNQAASPSYAPPAGQQQLPPPATDFIPGGQPQGMPMGGQPPMGNPGGMPGMPQR